MKNIKSLLCVVILFSSVGVSVLAEITASTKTNLIQKIASATSFTSTNQSSAQNANAIQNTTSSAIDGKQLRKTVEQEAKAFGLLVNEAALARESGIASTNKQLVKIGGPKNIYEDKRDLEPTLDTIVYDTGLMTLTKEGGHYNDDSSNTIFDASATQQARVKVYIDFKRKIFWGSVDSKITLDGASQMNNTYNGASADITSLPIDKELTHSIDDATGNPLSITDEPYAWYSKHATTSLVKADGTLAQYYDSFEEADMKKNVSHASGGDKNILVGAKFTTSGSGTPGQTTASFEASHASKNASDADFADGVVRYSGTTTTTATKYTGE